MSGSVHDVDWRVDAACADLPVEMFYPSRGEDHRPAKAVCARCPVRAECLRFALVNRENHGVWGGLSERERRRIRRSARAAGRPIPRLCDHCGGEFSTLALDRFCSETCRDDAVAAARRRERPIDPPTVAGVSPGFRPSRSPTVVTAPFTLEATDGRLEPELDTVAAHLGGAIPG